MKRRQFLKAGLGAVLAAGSLTRAEAQDKLGAKQPPQRMTGETAAPLVLWYDRPATRWLEAQPIGNGRLGAMVFGGTDQETLQLNEATVWAGGPHDYDNPEALAALPEIRRLVFADQWRDAESQVNAHFMGRPAGQASYQTIGSLTLDFGHGSAVTDYRRQLDLNTAIVTTSYMAAGVRYTREAFVSVPDQLIVLRLTADQPGKVSFAAALASPQQPTVRLEGTDTLVLEGVSTAAGATPGAVKFQVMTRVRTENGQVQAADRGLTVTGANAAILLISIGSSYRNYQDVSGDAARQAQLSLEQSAYKSWAELRQAHEADHQTRFHRLSLNLGTSSLAARPTDERIRTFATDHDPSLVALYCQFGRYLLLGSSRPGGQPANLQGLWNNSLNPPWGSKFTVNINTEMNYWPAAPGNMMECYEPLFAMIGDLSQTGARTAQVQYGAGGWVCHHNTDGWRGTAPVDYSGSGMWPTGGAWLCKSFWDHYEFTGNKEALKRHYPIMKGAAQFFLDTLVEEPTRHWLVTCPSVSPENSHHPGVSICAGPTMDMQILRDLFDACAQASAVLKTDTEFRGRVVAARARLAPMQIGAQGQLQEWLADWDAQAPEQHHRHVSHLYGLYPSNQITRRGTPALFDAARKSLETRGDESTGWAEAWRINLWARLEDGDHAHMLITDLLTPGHTAPNMFDLHPPFQIDGNFGGSAGIMEMLMQSQNGEIHLLPALPSAWPAGQVRGLLARGGFEIEIHWAAGKLERARILSRLGGPCLLRLGEQTHTFSTVAGHAYTIHSDLRVG